MGTQAPESEADSKAYKDTNYFVSYSLTFTYINLTLQLLPSYIFILYGWGLGRNYMIL